MKKVNLKEYPRFWKDFAEKVNAIIDPSAHLSSALIKLYIKDWYGINVLIMHSGSFGEVYMLSKDYTAFVLRWS